MSKLILTPEEGRNIVEGNNPEYTRVERITLYSEKFKITYQGIFRRLSDDTYWKAVYSSSWSSYAPAEAKDFFDEEGQAEFTQVQRIHVIKYVDID